MSSTVSTAVSTAASSPVSTAPRSAAAAGSAVLTISEVAAEAGVAVSAVRFYERHGLITSERTSGNQRRFGSGAGCRIRVARVAQRVGLTVREIAGLLDGLPADPGPQDWEHVARSLIAEARERVRALERALDDLGSGERLCELDPVGLNDRG